MANTLHPRAAALDIGSNTLKMLVVEQTPKGLMPVGERTSETRISEGISKDQPMLSEKSMQRGVQVIGQLYREMQSLQPKHSRIVATSAVRDASNREDFRRRVFEETGQSVDVISGEEEALLIGKGVLTDPALKTQKEIVIFDLGGGSVECIYIKDRTIEVAVSLPLGGVRLLEHHIDDASLPLTSPEIDAVKATVKAHADQLPIKLENPDQAIVVGAGGTWITSRAIIAHRSGKTLEESNPNLSMDQLVSVFDEVSNYNLKQRLKIPNLPPNRADVFPVTLLALIELGKWVGVSNFYHCFRSLRYGVAYVLLNGSK